MGFRILGTGTALPERVVTNDDLSGFLDTSDEWISQRTGIKTRHVCTIESLDDLAARAAEQALSYAGVDSSELDLIVCSTTSPDHIVPAQATAVGERIGASCPSFDVAAACAGFIFALDVADGWFARGRARRVLVVAAERYTRLMDWDDRATCVLFGDGAAAAVLGDGGEGFLSVNLTTKPDLEVLEVPGLPGTSPYDTHKARPCTLSMHGGEVFKYGVTSIVHEVRKLASDAGIAPQDINHFVFHQANGRILDSAVTRLGIDGDRVVRTLAQTGNISSACIPLALDKLVRAGEIAPGEFVAMVGFGAGLTTGSCLLRWDEKSAGVAPHAQNETCSNPTSDAASTKTATEGFTN